MDKSRLVFNGIAPIYGLFYKSQQRRFRQILDSMHATLDVRQYSSICDVGCGTGALCSVLREEGLTVTGVDPAANMLRIARQKTGNEDITWVKADAERGLPFADNQFDLCIASYVAHGMQETPRKQLYAEMSRIAKSYVIIHDYNDSRSWGTSLIEWLEGGDYFSFIKRSSKEMEACVCEMRRCFKSVEVVQVGPRANWYICTPNKE